MAYEVVWTFHAEEDYRQIIFYLKKEWTESVAFNFINTTEERIERVVLFPLLGFASAKDPSIRSIALAKHTGCIINSLIQKFIFFQYSIQGNIRIKINLSNVHYSTDCIE
jgi:plasmid stabilization system protein ParE